MKILLTILALTAIQLLHLAISISPDVADTNDVVSGNDRFEGP